MVKQNDEKISIKDIDLAVVDHTIQQAVVGIEGEELLVIKSPVEYAKADDLNKLVKSRIKSLTEDRLELTRPLDQAKEKIMAKYRPVMDRLEKFKVFLENGMRKYLKDQKDREDAEKRRAEAEAKKREEVRKATLQKKADIAQANGDIEKAEELRQQAEEVYIPPAVVVSRIPQLEGQSTSEKWSAVVVDIKALARAVADGVIPETYIKADLVVLNKVAQANKGKMPIPGVRFESNTIFTNR